MPGDAGLEKIDDRILELKIAVGDKNADWWINAIDAPDRRPLPGGQVRRTKFKLASKARDTIYQVYDRE